MAINPLRATLDTLRSEREGAERRAVELDEELKEVGQRLTHLRGAIENIEALLGEPSVEDQDVIEDEETARSEPEGKHYEVTIDDSVGVTDTVVVPIRKRVPSTDWVAEVVERIGRPADRDEIYKAFRHYKNIPESWTNPRNSVNNALGRAVERHMVRKLNDNLFAPMGYNPPGGDTDRWET